VRQLFAEYLSVSLLVRKPVPPGECIDPTATDVDSRIAVRTYVTNKETNVGVVAALEPGVVKSGR
jgi:hypothetical protein